MGESTFPFKTVEGGKFHVVVEFNPENAIAYDINDVYGYLTIRA